MNPLLFQIGQYQVISPIMCPSFEIWHGRNRIRKFVRTFPKFWANHSRTMNDTSSNSCEDMRHGPHHKQVISMVQERHSELGRKPSLFIKSRTDHSRHFETAQKV
jgi:hypothetical protein